jgi:DNA processing protein
MAGFAHAILIIEAGSKSGTLITARLANEYNRDLLCVPHRIGDPHGFGAHLFSRIGAATVTTPNDILEALHIEPRIDTELLSCSYSQTIKNLSDGEKEIYELLSEPHQRDELLRIIGIPIHEALSVLISLEFKGLAREEFGSWRRLP